MLQIVGSAPGFPHGIVDPIEVFNFFSEGSVLN